MVSPEKPSDVSDQKGNVGRKPTTDSTSFKRSTQNIVGGVYQMFAIQAALDPPVGDQGYV